MKILFSVILTFLTSAAFAANDQIKTCEKINQINRVYDTKIQDGIMKTVIYSNGAIYDTDTKKVKVTVLTTYELGKLASIIRSITKVLISATRYDYESTGSVTQANIIATDSTGLKYIIYVQGAPVIGLSYQLVGLSSSCD